MHDLNPVAKHPHRKIRHFIFASIAMLGVCPAARAGISESQVLVVFNSAAAGATTLKNAYLAAHPAISAANVLDLNSATLVANPANLTYAQYKDNIRDPIRAYLTSGAGPTPQSIICILLIRPMPHRIYDSDNASIGDTGSSANEVNAGDATYSSVDAELVLLWQNLDVGEAGATMDSKSDNMIVNPFHKTFSNIDTCGTCSRANIQAAKTFTDSYSFFWALAGTGASRLTPGDLYLVCRIDGNTLSDAEASITRASNLRINKATDWILLDEYNVDGGANDLDDDGLGIPNDPFLAGDDYEETRDRLVTAGWNVRYDGTADFIEATEETRPLIGYASYGENHDRCGGCEDPLGYAIYIDGFHFPPGAIFNTAESDNGRQLNGLGTVFGLEQCADFIAAGGTFAVGQVWEPFSFSLPDNEYLMTNFLVYGRTWAEAAYSALPALSWQNVVIGDPLARATVISDPGLPKGDFNNDGIVNAYDIEWFMNIVMNGPGLYLSTYPALDHVARGDFTGDFEVSVDDLGGFADALVAIP